MTALRPGRMLIAWCFRAETGEIFPYADLANSPLFGKHVSRLVHANCHAFGEDLFAVAKAAEGVVVEIDYFWKKPGSDQPAVQKATFAARVNDLVCGVPYFK